MAVTWHIRRTTGRVSARLAYTSQVATDIPWLINSRTNNNAFMDVADAAFDPSVANTLWISTGEAAWKTNPPTSATSFNWTSQSAGIEQLVANWILSPPNGTPIGLVSDKVGFQFNNLSAFPSAHIGASPAANPIVHSRGGDWASSTPSTIVILADILDFAGSESAVSSDGGSTWTKWTTTPAGVPTTYPGGSLAASTATNWVLVPSNHTPHVWYTTDGAANWNQATISGVPTSGETGWGFAYYLAPSYRLRRSRSSPTPSMPTIMVKAVIVHSLASINRPMAGRIGAKFTAVCSAAMA